MTRFAFLLTSFIGVIIILFPKTSLAAPDNQFITIVNPVRISSYTLDPAKSIEAQYDIVKKNQLPATWLLTYDALNHRGVVSVIKTMDYRQEIGIFLEVTPDFASAADVEYRDTGFWHHATSVFLSGYTQNERLKLIDMVFEKFEDIFGYYPDSVGSWWTDSYSLNYMHEKYGITGNLGVADQNSTDGYQIWGTYWSTPYYPSKYHSGIPAPSKEVKLDLVMFQWAPRDPLNGYKSSLFSTQDYFRKEVGQGLEYFEKLVYIYAKANTNQFGQITVGLEGDFNPTNYGGHFSRQMEVVRKLVNSGDFTVTNMQQFSNWYRDKFGKLSPEHVVETDDLLGENKKVYWYQSPRYRIGLEHDYENKYTKVFDFRSYHADMQEPYYKSPNREFDLSINVPSYFDELNYASDVWEMNLGKLEGVEGSKMTFSDGEIQFSEDGFSIIGLSNPVPEVLTNNPAIKINDFENRIDIVVKESWLVSREGATHNAFTPEATHFLGARKLKLAMFGLATLYLVGVALLIRSSRNTWIKVVVPTLIAFVAISGIIIWRRKNMTTYLIPQGEIEVLQRLSVLPKGKVLVYDNECLQCEYHTDLKPAAFANKRGYVKKFSGKDIVYSSEMFEAKTREDAKKEFEKEDTEYIYLVKFEDYIEKTPFSPGDLGIERLYENANAELWRKKN